MSSLRDILLGTPSLHLFYIPNFYSYKFPFFTFLDLRRKNKYLLSSPMPSLTPVKCGERLNGQSQPTQVARTIDRPSIQIISVVAMVDVDPAKYERIRGMWLSIFGKEFNSATMRGSGDLLRSLEMSGGRSTQV